MEKRRYHFVGIGGISMSSLARLLIAKGYIVSGSDLCINEQCVLLKKLGAKIYKKHSINNIKHNPIVVYNCATDNNVETLYAKEINLIVISRAELLSKIAKDYKKVISISGTHGKTTTAAMMYHCLKRANYNPTLHIGGLLHNHNFGYIEGSNDIFITEACEFKDSFLSLRSTYGVILNIEQEHLDYFKNYKNLLKSFEKFAKNSKKTIILEKNYISNLKNQITFGEESSTYYAKNLVADEYGRYSFDLYTSGQYEFTFKLNCVGRVNINNALSVIGVCKDLNLTNHQIQNGFDDFAGIKRRFQYLGKNRNYLIHDYAHHPTEIENVIKDYKYIVKDKKIAVIFQPHTFSRTKQFMNDFLRCFNLAQYVGIVKEYSAREKYDENASAFALFNNLKKDGCNAFYYDKFLLVIKKIKSLLKQNYAVLILGAGDIEKVANYLDKLC